MGKVTAQNQISNLMYLADVVKYQSILNNDIVSQLNGNITFKDNMHLVIVDQFFSLANSEVLIRHNLNRVPTGFLAIGMNMATTIYNGDSPWTSENIFLKSTVASAQIRIMIF